MSDYRPLHRLIVGRDNPGPTRLAEGTYVELVRSLFTTLLPACIMAISFTAVGFFIIQRTPDRWLTILFGLGVAAALLRLTILLLFRNAAANERLSVVAAGQLERRFALSYLIFAVAFGAFSARALVTIAVQDHMLIVGLIFGYGAGVATGISLRPWISISASLLAVAPAIIVSLTMTHDPSYLAIGLLTALFLAGGIESMLRRYKGAAKQISMRRLLSTLARRDSLTGLPNRLLLGDRFAALDANAAGTDLVAVHRLDLELPTSIDAVYGDDIGDALLKAVAESITRALQPGDFAVRLGGVELAIVQTGLAQAREAQMFARSAISAVARSYAIEGHIINIDASIGYTCETQQDAELEHMLACAHEALQRAKREHAAVAAYEKPRWRSKASRFD